MRFAWPLALLLLAVAPLLGLLYWWWLRRKRTHAVQYSSLSLIRAAMPPTSTWRRRLPLVFMAGALTSLALGAARPHRVLGVEQNQTSIILALDISRSMCAVDIEPNRLTVAQAAASAFISDQAGAVQIGIVAFSSSAQLIVPPTADTEVLLDAVENLRTSFGTALGRAQLEAVDAISELNPAVVSTDEDLEGSASGDDDAADVEFVGDIVVLLTDGANSSGPEPLDAARAAADRGVRVYTIGFGTDQPTQMLCGTTQIGADAFGNGEFGAGGFGGDSFGGLTGSTGGGGGRGSTVGDSPPQQLVIDEPALVGIAEITSGEYFRAQDADQLTEVFLNLPTNIELEDREIEISVWFTTAGLVLLLAGLAVSLRFNRF